MGACLVYAIALQNPVWGLMNSVCVCVLLLRRHTLQTWRYMEQEKETKQNAPTLPYTIWVMEPLQ